MLNIKKKYFRHGEVQKLCGQVEVGVCGKKGQNYVYVLDDPYPYLNGKYEIFWLNYIIGQIPSNKSVYANLTLTFQT